LAGAPPMNTDQDKGTRIHRCESVPHPWLRISRHKGMKHRGDSDGTK
jgi:hypothetical protein